MKPYLSKLAPVLLLIRVASAQVALPGANPPASAPAEAGSGIYWYKGNTHTHSWWSDGDSPPETIVKWYKEHGYNFFMLSDHNKLAEGERWHQVKNAAQEKAAALYEKTFGDKWVVKRGEGKDTEYRLKTLREYSSLFSEPDKFLLINGEEITDAWEKNPIHLNGINLREVIEPRKGKDIPETIQNDVNAVHEQSAKYKQPMLVHIDHPNFQWALRLEDMLSIKGGNFFEVFNGHSGVRNYGDENRASTERMWDVMLAKRLGELHMPIMYGIADDDAHCYTSEGVGKPNPGRGWIMVRAARLAPEDIILAMEKGDFYPTTGVILKEIRFDGSTLAIDIDARPGIAYSTEFIGTLKGFDPKPIDRFKDPRGFLYNKYSATIGQVLSEVSGPRAAYKMTGKEIYVRAKITSTAEHPNPFQAGDFEVAWTQPVVPAQPKAPSPGIR